MDPPDRGFTTIVSFRVEFLHFVNETETYYCQNLTARAMFSDKTIIFGDTAKFWTHTFPEFVTNALTIRAYFVNTIDIGQGSCTPTHCIMVYYFYQDLAFSKQFKYFKGNQSNHRSKKQFDTKATSVQSWPGRII